MQVSSQWGHTAPCAVPFRRRKNDPLDFVALMEAQEAAEEPEFELLARRAAGEGRRRRAKPAAKTLLPEDHHYKASGAAPWQGCMSYMLSSGVAQADWTAD